MCLENHAEHVSLIIRKVRGDTERKAKRRKGSKPPCGLLLLLVFLGTPPAPASTSLLSGTGTESVGEENCNFQFEKIILCEEA